MSKDPAFLFYPNDYIGGTMGMTFEEKGAYIELLMLQFNRGHMTSDMIGQTVGRTWDKVSGKFIQDDKGLYYNERLEIEIKKRQSFVKSRFNNLDGNNQYTKKPSDTTDHMEGHKTNHMEDVNVNRDLSVIETINIEFDIFWNLYAKKVDRIKCEKKWKALTDQERENCIYNLPAYIQATPEVQFRRDPATYLNNKSWQNEIIKHENNRRDNKRNDKRTNDYWNKEDTIPPVQN